MPGILRLRDAFVVSLRWALWASPYPGGSTANSHPGADDKGRRDRDHCAVLRVPLVALVAVAGVAFPAVLSVRTPWVAYLYWVAAVPAIVFLARWMLRAFG